MGGDHIQLLVASQCFPLIIMSGGTVCQERGSHFCMITLCMELEVFCTFSSKRSNENIKSTRLGMIPTIQNIMG